MEMVSRAFSLQSLEMECNRKKSPNTHCSRTGQTASLFAAAQLDHSVYTMKCKSCGKTYSAAISQPAPGGSSAPGVFFILAALLYGIAGFLFVFHPGFWKWIVLGVSVFVSIQVPIAWMDCRGSAGLHDHGGEKCTSCGATNTVYPWSL